MIGNFFAKLLEKLPLHRLPPRMTYALSFNALLFFFMTALFATETTFGGFPNAWDYRFMLAVNLTVFVIGVWNAWDRRE